MSDAAVGFVCIGTALAFVCFAVWQWRSGKFIDPIFSAFAPQVAKRPLMWLSTVFYGLMGAGSLYVAFHLLTGN